MLEALSLHSFADEHAGLVLLLTLLYFASSMQACREGGCTGTRAKWSAADPASQGVELCLLVGCDGFLSFICGILDICLSQSVLACNPSVLFAAGTAQQKSNGTHWL